MGKLSPCADAPSFQHAAPTHSFRRRSHRSLDNQQSLRPPSGLTIERGQVVLRLQNEHRNAHGEIPLFREANKGKLPQQQLSLDYLLLCRIGRSGVPARGGIQQEQTADKQQLIAQQQSGLLSSTLANERSSTWLPLGEVTCIVPPNKHLRRGSCGPITVFCPTDVQQCRTQYMPRSISWPMPCRSFWTVWSAQLARTAQHCDLARIACPCDP
eukprot:scaffold2360_cov380-Prasinococcus_capsulatus_cf.AAC.10